MISIQFDANMSGFLSNLEEKVPYLTLFGEVHGFPLFGVFVVVEIDRTFKIEKVPARSRSKVVS